MIAHIQACLIVGGTMVMAGTRVAGDRRTLGKPWAGTWHFLPRARGLGLACSWVWPRAHVSRHAPWPPVLAHM